MSPSKLKFSVVGAVGAGLGAIGSVASSALAANMSRDSVREMNEYNSPDKQVNRLKAAGLNPYLMSGAIGAGNQAAAADMSVAGNALVNGANNTANIVSQLGINAATIRKTNAEAEAIKIDNQTREAKNQVDLDTAKANLQDIQFKVDSLNPAQLELLNNQAKEVAQKNQNLVLESDNLKHTANKLLEEIKGLDLSNQEKEIFVNQYEAYLRLQRSYLVMQTKTGYLNANSNATNAAANYLDAQTGKYLSSYQSGVLEQQKATSEQQMKHTYWQKEYYRQSLPHRVEEAQAAASLAQQQNDAFEGDKFWRRIGMAINGAGEVVNAYGQLRGPDQVTNTTTTTTNGTRSKGRYSSSSTTTHSKSVKPGKPFGRLRLR